MNKWRLLHYAGGLIVVTGFVLRYLPLMGGGGNFATHVWGTGLIVGGVLVALIGFVGMPITKDNPRKDKDG